MALMTQVGLEFIARNRATGTMNQFQVSVANLGRTMLRMAGLGGGIYAIQRGFVGMIRAASDAQEILNKFNVVFREHANEAAQWAEQFGDQVGRSTRDVEKWMAGLQDLFVPLGFTRDKAFELSKSLTQLAVDVASFNNQADADVIRDFQSALVGNHEAVRKYGIIITEASLKQEALNKGYNKSYQELTNLEKVTLRMGIIQASTTDAQGDALRTADSYANQIKRLSANWEELSEKLGTLVLPAVTKLVQGLNSVIGETDKVSESWENLTWVLTNRFLNSAMADPVKAAQWTLAIQAYDREMGNWIQTVNGFRVPAEIERFFEMFEHYRKGALTFPLPRGVLKIPEDRLRYMEEMSSRAAELQPPVGTDGAMAMTVEQLRRAKEQVRDYVESVRHMDYQTRMERIENLEAYRRAHANIMYDTVGQETEANQLIQREIDALLRSRLDAMEIYRRELREDFESFNLYLSERFADVARDIERSGATLAKNMIRDWENWRDHVRSFFESVADAFADMAAQMIARWLMMKAMGMTGGGGGSPLGAGEAANPFGGFGAGEAHRGAIVGQDNLPIRYVSPKLFENAPRYHDLEPGDVAIIAQRGEEISRPGRTRTTQPPNVIINNNTGQPFTTDGPPSFDGERWVVSVVAQNIRQGGALKKIVRR